METIKSFRVIFPPFTLYGSLLLTWVFDGSLVDKLGHWEAQHVLTPIGAIAAAAVVPLGYFIGGITTLGMAVIGRIRRKPHSQITVDDGTAQKVWSTLNLSGTARNADLFYSVQAFGHGLDKWLVDYLDRLWDAASGYAGAVTAILAAIVIGVIANLPRPAWWWATLIGVGVVAVLMVVRNRSEIANLVAFYEVHPEARVSQQPWASKSNNH